MIDFIDYMFTSERRVPGKATGVFQTFLNQHTKKAHNTTLLFEAKSNSSLNRNSLHQRAGNLSTKFQ